MNANPASRRRWFAATLLLVACFIGLAASATPAAAAEITRRDIAEAYLRVDREMKLSREIDAETFATINLEFDQATLRFFSGEGKYSIDRLNKIVSLLRERAGDECNLAELSAAATVSGSVDRPVIVAGSKGPLVLTLRPVASTLSKTPIELSLVMTSRGDVTGTFANVTLPIDKPTRVTLLDSTESLAPGEHVIELRGSDNSPTAIAKMFVTPIDVDQARRAMLKSIDDLVATNSSTSPSANPSTNPAVKDAAAAVRSRANLLTSTPSDQLSASFLADPNRLLAELPAEIDALTRGEDPFAKRTGDYWRTFESAGVSIPARVYVPPTLDLTKPAPLVFALHGAAADENIFFEAYGLGEIKRQADRFGFIVVAPSTYAFLLPGSKAFDEILTRISIEYPIDPKRVFVIGHSLGAITAGGLAVSHRDAIAGVVQIAGVTTYVASNRPSPIIAFNGDLDPIFRIEKMREIVAANLKQGVRIQFKEVKGAGHTLLIRDAVREGCEWMMNR